MEREGEHDESRRGDNTNTRIHDELEKILEKRRRTRGFTTGERANSSRKYHDQASVKEEKPGGGQPREQGTGDAANAIATRQRTPSR